jgi:hypothetical protein
MKRNYITSTMVYHVFELKMQYNIFLTPTHSNNQKTFLKYKFNIFSVNKNLKNKFNPRTNTTKHTW